MRGSFSRLGAIGLVILVASAAAVSTLGAASPTPASSTPEELLDELRSAQASVVTLRAGFRETRRFVHFGEEETREGTLCFKRDLGVRIDFDAPGSEVVVASKGFALVFNPHAMQLQRFELPKGAQVRGPLWPLLPGDDAADDAPGQLETTAAPDDLEGFCVIPRAESLHGSYVRRCVFIDRGDGLPRRIELTEANGDVLIYEFPNMEPGVALEDGLFRFRPPKGTEIMDVESPLRF